MTKRDKSRQHQRNAQQVASRLPAWLLVITLTSMAAACKRTTAQKSDEPVSVTVSGTVMQTEAYCGGAAPNPQKLEAMRTPKPLAGKKIYFKAGRSNDPDAPVVAETTSDDRGEFTASLPPGSYVVVDERRVDSASYDYMLANFGEPTENYSAVDKRCLDEWVKQADLAFEIADTTAAPLNIVFHKPCSWNSFPCVQFTGERPR